MLAAHEDAQSPTDGAAAGCVINQPAVMRDRKISSSQLSPLSGARSGAIAGVLSTLIFAVIHDLLISNIWFSLVAMLVAGALCGAGLGISFSLVSEGSSRRDWIRFNLVFLGLFVALAIASVVIYDPITSVSALIAANEAPSDLIQKAAPLIVGFVLFSTFSLCRIYGSRFSSVIALFATILVLTVFLGLNVAIIGLVEVTAGTFYLIAELFGLIAILAASFGTLFLFLQRKTISK